MSTIILFGGVFDPVHTGHLSIYKTIKKHYQFQKFIIIPSKNPPLKTHLPFADCKDRMMMLRLMFRNCKDVEISDYEINQKNREISYTFNTLKYFKKLYPHATFYFIIGTDRYLDFKKWKNWKTILKLARLVVVKRNNQKFKKDIPADFVNIKLVPTCSSALRKLPQVKFLTPIVALYIATFGLYTINQVQPLMSLKRFQHTIRVAKLAIQIGRQISPLLGLKAYIAAMYHDISKEMSDAQIKKLAPKWNKNKYPTIHTLHGVASAVYAKKFFNIKDKEILNAIANHVIPSSKPSKLDMILYCADKLEPNRTNEDVTNREDYVELAKKNLKVAFTKLLKEMYAHYN